jgi:hypothetical protein
VLGEYAAESCTPVVVVFVGHKGSSFPVVKNARIQKIWIQDYQIVFVSLSIALPVTDVAYTINFSTLREADNSKREIEAVQPMRRGKSQRRVKELIRIFMAQFELDVIKKSGFLARLAPSNPALVARVAALEAEIAKDESIGYMPIPGWLPRS